MLESMFQTENSAENYKKKEGGNGTRETNYWTKKHNKWPLRFNRCFQHMIKYSQNED